MSVNTQPEKQMNTIKLSLLCAITLGFGACSDSVVDKVSSWKDAACACKDKECATKQGKAFIELGEKHKGEKPSKEDGKKLKVLAKEGRKCLKDLDVDIFDLK